MARTSCGPSLSEPIFHITTAAAWRACDGSFSAGSLDTEGFIHCSTAAQAAWVANGRFRGLTQPLVLLQLDPDSLTAELKWESSEPAMPPFPHIYGPIDRAAVVRVIDFPEGPEGFIAPNG